MTEDRILFFASGDFAIDTFESLLENGFNVVGLVTSKDSVKFHKYRISDVAREHGVPTYTVRNDVPMEEDGFFIDWLKRVNADIYCVISFKKLPSKIVKMAKKCAFNVHASLLPFLRGAAPINWAIRLGYKETGLTAFVLNDNIDCGDIIANTKVKIEENEKFTTLFKKLSEECIDFTKMVIDNHLQRENWEDYLISQGVASDSDILLKASKIDLGYFDCDILFCKPEQFKQWVNSVDDTGFNCIIEVIEVKDKNYNIIKKIKTKIYEVEVDKDAVDDMYNKPFISSDGKKYIGLNLFSGGTVFIKKIQIDGKKVMDVETFLNGFRYFREDGYKVGITKITEKDE